MSNQDFAAAPATRRAFLTTAVTAASYQRILGANNRIQVGFIGYGLIGKRHVTDFKTMQDVDCAALCDVYKPRLDAGLAQCGPQAKGYSDFRKMLDNKDLQGIIVGTPDHWHTLLTVLACAAGKDVYVEKPLAMNMRELIRAYDAVKRSDRIVQIGTQMRSYANSNGAKKMLAAGELGKILKVEQVRNGYSPYWMSYGGDAFFGLKPTEADVDWKAFLGDRKPRPFDPMQYQGWYGFRDFSRGPHTNLMVHFIDLVHFITGLLPVSVSIYGVLDKYPNGRKGYLWTDARILWNSGACLNVQNALGFPDDAPGTNTQGLTMYCAGEDKGSLISHSDQYRGLKYSYVRKDDSPGSTIYAEPSTDYLQYIDLGGKGLVPVGYGYRSVEFIVEAAIRAEAEAEGLPEAAALAKRQQVLKEYDEAGVMATPANSSYNELVIEAGRLSIVNGGREAVIEYGDRPRVRLRD